MAPGGPPRIFPAAEIEPLEDRYLDLLAASKKSLTEAEAEALAIKIARLGEDVSARLRGHRL
jgi:hypothetical protein